MITRTLPAILCIVLLAAPARAAQCGGDFDVFIAAMSREAAAAGVSQQIISTAFAGITHDPAVMAFDRRQRGTFRKSFEEYARTRVTEARIKRARTLMARHAGPRPSAELRPDAGSPGA
jgi:membrane-bound lytic murein transglycosylase B